MKPKDLLKFRKIILVRWTCELSYFPGQKPNNLSFVSNFEQNFEPRYGRLNFYAFPPSGKAILLAAGT
jgi:hypothetical protein